MDADDARDLEKYLKEKKKAEAKGKLKEVAEFCNCIGEIYSRYGRYQEAIQEHAQELHLSEALGDRIGEAVANRRIGECHCFLGQFEQALSHQKKHLECARACGNDLEEQRAWATIGKTYFCQSETRNIVTLREALRRAERAYTKALESCEKVKSTVKVEEYMAMKGRLYLNIGLVFESRGEVKPCVDVIKRAVAIAERFKLDDELYMCHSSLSSVYFKTGDSSQALRFADLALKMAEKLRDRVREKEMHLHKAQILVNIGDFLAAKHSLKKANKLRVNCDTSQANLKKMFSCVNKMQEAALDIAKTSEQTRLAELFEVCADCSAEIGNYSDAAEYYLKTLQYKEVLTAEKRADIYASLAQTYADLKQNDKAIFYYQQEITERGHNYEQRCRTLLNIAELEELGGAKYSVVCRTYMSAFEAASKASHGKLQLRTLKSLTLVQKACKQVDHLKETEKKLESLTKKYGDVSSSDEDEESDDDGKASVSGKDKNGEDLSLSDLTLSEQSEDENDAGMEQIRNKKTKLARRNEKGETPLHRACIDGNIKKVKTLIGQGHPINPRDFCGWLPLHEASNHGHVEVVRCLLDAGAWINDRGGDKCGGVTPLIDAANCGNMAIVRLLVGRGASLQAKDDDGNTALDCLQAWYSRVEDTLGPGDVLEYKTTEKMLHVKGESSRAQSNDSSYGKNNSSSHSGSTSVRRFRGMLTDLRSKKESNRKAPRRGTKSSTDRSEPFSLSDSLSDSEPAPYALPKAQVKTSKNGVKEYQSVMETIGSSVQKRLGFETNVDSDQREEQSLPALLDEREDMGDDWLIDDIDTVRPKKKSIAVESLFTTTGSRKRTRVGEKQKAIRAEKKSRVRMEEALPSTSSNLSFEREPHERMVNVSSGSRKSAAILADIFDDHSSNEACLVTSSTEPQKAAPVTDDWGSDDELLSYMNGMDDDSFEFPNALPDLDVSSNSVSSRSNAVALADPVVSSVGASNRPNTNQDHFVSNATASRRQTLAQNSSRIVTSTAGFHHGIQQTSTFTGNSTYSDSSTGETHRAQQPQQIRPAPSEVMNQQHVAHRVETAPPQPQAVTMMRIKVRVGPQTLLLPITPACQDRTILWLCQETSQRYFNSFLVRPLLTLSTSDGSILSPMDTIASVLTNDDILTGVVRSWERPSLKERYIQACRLCLIEEEPSQPTITQLQACEQSGALVLSDVGLTSVLLQPVFQALDGQTTLTELTLSGNKLGDAGVVPLISLLSSLPVLKVLNLDSAGLSVEGVRSMAAALKLAQEPCMALATSGQPSGGDLLGNLSQLSLGHNILEDVSASALASLVYQLPKLNSLQLPGCGFTQNIFTPDFCQALRSRSLAHVSMAENNIKTQGVSLLLDNLHSDCLQSLDISYSRTVTGENLLPMIESFASNDSSIETLTLAGCNLTESDAVALNRLVVDVPSLRSLSLSQNASVTNKSLQKLLALSTNGGSKLESLTARGCGLMAPLGSELLEALSSKVKSAVPLVKLVMSFKGLKPNDSDKLKAIWVDKWRDRAVCKVIGVAVSFTVKDIVC